MGGARVLPSPSLPPTKEKPNFWTTVVDSTELVDGERNNNLTCSPPRIMDHYKQIKISTDETILDDVTDVTDKTTIQL